MARPLGGNSHEGNDCREQDSIGLFLFDTVRTKCLRYEKKQPCHQFNQMIIARLLITNLPKSNLFHLISFPRPGSQTLLSNVSCLISAGYVSLVTSSFRTFLLFIHFGDLPLEFGERPYLLRNRSGVAFRRCAPVASRLDL